MPKKKNKINKNWFLIVIAIVVLFAIVLLLPSENIVKSSQGQEQETPAETKAGDICKRNPECFLINCKSMPSVIECVNTTHQDFYYKQCKGWWDVNPVQDFTRCACNQGICTAK